MAYFAVELLFVLSRIRDLLDVQKEMRDVLLHIMYEPPHYWVILGRKYCGRRRDLESLSQLSGDLHYQLNYSLGQLWIHVTLICQASDLIK